MLSQTNAKIITGGASFPTIVTDSGSSLPSASGYQEGDTFLNTSDKKIYKAEVGGYIQNTNIYSSGTTVDLSTGIATGFTGSSYIARTMPNNSKEWSGTGVSYKVHFKATSFSSWDNNKFQVIFRSQSGYQSDNYSTAIAIQNKQMYLILANTYSSSQKTGTKLFDYEILENTEYFFRITKNGTTAFAELFIGGYDGTLVASGTIETQDNIVSLGSRQTYIRYGMNQEWRNSNVENFINGEVYLIDSEGELLIPSPDLSWDGGTDLTDKTEYADKTNGALYLYENSELVKIGSSAPTVLTDQASTSMALAGNTIYKWTSALTSLSFASVEVSDLETVLYFTTGGTITFTDSSSLKWGGDGSAPSLEINTIYCISIRNGLAEIDTFGTVS